jgi:hypothetical protein
MVTELGFHRVRLVQCSWVANGLLPSRRFHYSVLTACGSKQKRGNSLSDASAHGRECLFGLREFCEAWHDRRIAR